MKGYDPITFTRNKWYDPKHTKNRPHTCEKSHSFCNFDYEWGTENTRTGPINRPINAVTIFRNIGYTKRKSTHASIKSNLSQLRFNNIIKFR